MCCPDAFPTSTFLLGLMCLTAFSNFAKTSADFSGLFEGLEPAVLMCHLPLISRFWHKLDVSSTLLKKADLASSQMKTPIHTLQDEGWSPRPFRVSTVEVGSKNTRVKPLNPAPVTGTMEMGMIKDCSFVPELSGNLLAVLFPTTLVCGAGDTLEGVDAILKGLDRLETRAHVNDMKFNKAKCKLLHLDQGDPKHRYKLGQ
ncbi:hypothetical protein DUI87_05723 [Hirundo rustica rustica]|uniref:Uncharacterized protein n=1 Tax=Hirundo rustica rustica TaxID=333673 RepID=A0A3M0KWF6_HIRRU|nr:hypothetical protein DUI87_05723 [Hirundo rustica rustica]